MEESISEIPYGYCHCGCGEKTTIASYSSTKRGVVKGEPRRFLPVHGRRKCFLKSVNGELAKLCAKCREYKSLSEFSPRIDALGGVNSWCKKCCSKHRVALPPKTRLLSQAKRLAFIKGVPFSITEKDIVVPDIDPVLGIPLTQHKGKAAHDSFSIDEIIPGVGYVPGNVQVISRKANAMKQNATPEELLKFAEWVYRTHGTEAIPNSLP